VLLALSSAPLASIAQQPGTIWRVGYISVRPESGPNEAVFRLGLRELGYVEGQNVTIEWRFGKAESDRYREIAAELVRLKMDCIVAVGVDATLQAKLATTSIPVVMVSANEDPVRRGLVASLAHPGGNVTGFTVMGADLAGKRLGLLKEILPKATRMAVLWDRDSLPATSHVKETEAAARALGVQVQSLDVGNADALESAFQSASKGGAQALVVVGTGLMNSHQPRIANFAAKTRLPAIYTTSQFVDVGGLMSYAADGVEQYRGAATYVGRILKGEKPASLPVQQPTKFELVINLKTARTLGIRIPQSVLLRADRVIE
jgi:putative ABC transport system substrate-binding protein